MLQYPTSYLYTIIQLQCATILHTGSEASRPCAHDKGLWKPGHDTTQGLLNRHTLAGLEGSQPWRMYIHFPIKGDNVFWDGGVGPQGMPHFRWSGTVKHASL